MRKCSRYARAAPASIAWLIASALVAFPFAVASGFGIYDTAPHRWLGGSDGYVIFASFFVLPFALLTLTFHLLLRRRIFGGAFDWPTIVAVAFMAMVDGLMIYQARVIVLANHFAAGSKTIDVADCDAKPFFTQLERCNGRTYGFIRITTEAHIAAGTPRWTLARLRAVGGTQPNGDSDCELPEVHHPTQCSRFGLPAKLTCFYCRKSGRWPKSSLLAFSPMSGKLIRVWSNQWDLSQPQSRPDRLTEYFDTVPYWSAKEPLTVNRPPAEPPARPSRAR